MTLKKPSELFNKKIEENNISIIESDNTLRDELSKVENLSDQIIQLQQELSQKVIQSDLEELFSSQINNIQENFENLQNDFKKSNKRDINNFNELKNIVSNNITDVKEEVYNIVGLLSNNLEEYSKELLNIRADVIINEHHINKVNKYFKEGVFSETEKSTFNNIKNNIVRLEKKIDFIRETYSKIEPEVIIREAINQDILNDPSDTENSDPLTPLDQKFVTLDQLQQHYRLFINRIQQQISTIGGGGETRLKYLDDIVGIATNSSSYDGKYLKYNHSLGKFEFADVSSSISGIATYASNAGIATFATSAGIATFASNAGIATYTSEWVLSAVGSSDYTFTGPGFTGAENDPVLYLVRGQQYKFTNTMGQHPFRIQSTVNGSAGTQYNDGIVNNDVSNGTLTWNVQFDSPGLLYYQCTAHGGMGGKIYIIDAGIGPDISINTTGIITATSFVGNGSGLTGIVGSGSSQFVITAAGIHTLSNVGIGTTNPQGTLQVGTGITMYGSTGIISATTFVGNFSGSITNATNLTGGYANASQLNVSGIVTISQGRIQADGSSNLRFGNLRAGSGSVRNIAIGDQVLYSLSGGQGRNIGIGELSYYDTTSGQYNIGLGIQAGQKITTGNYNVILGGYDGQTGLDIRTSSNNVVIADGQGNIRQYINSSGNVGIKTTVITEALTVAGIVSATSFYGTLNAGQLTGPLPAIDGSALIGVVGSGSGIIIQENGTPVGTAGTINFASNLNVTFASGIATVSGTGLATYANVAGIATYATSSGVSTTSGTANYATSSGVSTTSGTAGYATTAGISSAVSASININTTGIITASSFSGSGSGLTNLPAAQLTGTLPSIDGSALLNVTAVGTGIAIRDDNSNIGSATTVNFGTGLDVTFSSGIATITASGGSLQSRTTVSGVTTSITNNGIGNTNITGFKSYALMKVGLSTAGWLRLYTDSTSRTNDISRSVGEDPAPGSGVIAEVVTTGITTTQIISPFVMGGNLDNSPTTTIYAAIKNLSGSTQAITANITILQLEA